MRAVLQRVTRTRVIVEGNIVGEIGEGRASLRKRAGLMQDAADGDEASSIERMLSGDAPAALANQCRGRPMRRPRTPASSLLRKFGTATSAEAGSRGSNPAITSIAIALSSTVHDSGPQWSSV